METISFSRAVNWICSRILQEHLPLDRTMEERLKKDARLGLEVEGLDYQLFLEIENSWGVSATLNVDLRFDHQASREDNGNEHFKLRCQMNWPSMYRSLVTAQASVALYQRLTNLGCAIQCRFEGVRIANVQPEEVVDPKTIGRKIDIAPETAKK